MEKIALILIALALFILVVVLVLLTMLIYKLIKNPPSSIQQVSKTSDHGAHPDISRTEFHPEILERISQMQSVRPKRADLFCPNHIDEPGEVMCAICDKLYCKACIKPFKTMHFCKEHTPLVMRHDWDEVLTLKTSTSDPELGVELYQLKKDLFEKENIPTYIETHYKINVEQDFIETYLVLFAIKENVAELKDRLEIFIKQDK